MIKNKQNGIIEVLEQRIADGIYGAKLPKALDLAAEFELNFKTLNKAILRLAEKGLVCRKPGLGTFISKESRKLKDSLIELLFVGSSEISVHPFYSEMWRGILDGIDGTVFRLILNILEENKKYGGLKKVCRDFTPSAGKILIGTNNTEQIKCLKRTKVPFILVGERSSDSDVVLVYNRVRSELQITQL